MARVIVIGAGLAGLATAMEASVRGHHVVVLDQRSTIGGRASSELRDDFPIGFGPHLLLKKGPLHRLLFLTNLKHYHNYIKAHPFPLKLY